MTQRPTLQSVW